MGVHRRSFAKSLVRVFRLLFVTPLTAGAFAFLAALPPQAHSLALSDLRTEARVLALDNGATRRRFPDARVNAFLNEGQRQIVLEARPILKSSNFELVAGTTWYSLPSDFLQLNRVTRDYYTLPETTPDALDRTSRWEETGASATHYLVDFSSRTKIRLYPWPESSSSTGTVRYQYWAQATDMSADADTPFNGIAELTPYHYVIAYFAAAKMSAIDGKTGLAALYLGEFRAGIERIKSEAKSRPSYRPGAAGRTQ